MTIISGERVIVKVKEKWLAEKHNIPETAFRAYVTSQTPDAILLNGKVWLPKSKVDLASDIYMTGDAFKARDISIIPKIGKHIFEPWDHQLKTMAYLKANKGGFALLGMGTGKTKVTIDILQNDPACKCVLVVCPKNIMGVWRSQFTDHAVNCDQVFEIFWEYPKSWSVAKISDYLREQIRIALMLGKIPVMVINYDSVWRKDMLNMIMEQDWSHIVLDESHRIKSYNGEASKGMWKVGDHFRGKAMLLMLTGTVMPHSPVDIWSQFRFFNPLVFGKSYVGFRNRFCVTSQYNPGQVVGFINQDDMNKLLYQHAIRYGRDVVKLPDATHTFIKVDLEREARKVYESLKEELWAELESGTITVSNALVKGLRLCQITGGCAKDDLGNISVVSHAKEKALEELLEDMDLDEPVVIFARFIHDMDVIRSVCMRVGRTVSELSGRMKQLQEWQDGKTNCLVVHPKCGAEGVTFVRARYNVIYSLGFEGGTYKQLISRSHRHGQTRDVTFYHLQCKDSMDEVIYRALQAKDNITEDVLSELRCHNRRK